MIEKTDRPTRLPPIRIMDILLLTASAAFVFMIQERSSRQQEYMFADSAIEFAYRLSFAIPTAFSITAIFWLVLQKRITGRYFWHPGHWLIASYMVATVGGLAVWSVPLLVQGDLAFDDPVLLFGLTAVIEFVAFVFLSCASVMLVGIWRWIVASVALTFFTRGLSYSIDSVFISRSLLGTGGPVWQWVDAIQVAMGISFFVAVILLTIAIFLDCRQKVKRDWLHWVGVVVALYHVIVIPIITWIQSYWITFHRDNDFS